MPTSKVQAFLAHTCAHVPARRVAEIIGVAESEVSRWRSGDRSPSIDRYLAAVDAVVGALPELAEELLEHGVGPGVAGLVHGPPPDPDPEPPSDDNVVDLRAWAERRGRWSVVPVSVGRRAA